LAFASVFCVSAAAPPRLDSPSSLWNFGRVTNAVILSQDFLLLNRGESDLTVTCVVSGCDACLTASPDASVIPAGGSSRLRCRLDIRKLQGWVRRTITVDSNDPKRPSFEFLVEGYVAPAYRCQPPEAILRLGSGSNAAQIRVTPLVQLRSPLKVLECADTNLLATVAEAGRGSFNLNVGGRGEFPPGRKESELLLGTGHPEDPQCLITVLIDYPPALEVIPPILHLQVSSTPQARILWVNQHGSEPLRLVDVIAPSKELRCEMERVPPGSDYRIHVWFSGRAHALGTEAALLLKLEDRMHEQRTWTVPIQMDRDVAADSKTSATLNNH